MGRDDRHSNLNNLKREKNLDYGVEEKDTRIKIAEVTNSDLFPAGPPPKDSYAKCHTCKKKFKLGYNGQTRCTNCLFERWKQRETTPRTESARVAKRVRRGISKVRRSRIYERDDYTCVRCGLDMHKLPEKRSLHHVLAIINGGRNHDWNLETMCTDCNNELGPTDPTPEEIARLKRERPNPVRTNER